MHTICIYVHIEMRAITSFEMFGWLVVGAIAAAAKAALHEKMQLSTTFTYHNIQLYESDYSLCIEKQKQVKIKHTTSKYPIYVGGEYINAETNIKHNKF